MSKQHRRTALIGVGLAAIALGTVLWFFNKNSTSQQVTQETPPAVSAANHLQLLPEDTAQTPDKDPLLTFTLSAEDAQFINNLRARFSGRIHTPYGQVKLIEQVIAYLMAKYPDQWQKLGARFMRQLFPELADELAQRFENLVVYSNWLRENREMLRPLSPAERAQAIWEARRTTFGQDADAIWAVELKNQQVRSTLEALQSADHLNVGEKFSVYLDAVRQAHGEQAQDLIRSRQTELLSSFLDTSAVQADLNRLTVTARNAALREMRAGVGMDEAALGRWDNLDQQRDQVWDTGQRYMQAREQIMTKYQGDERQQQLKKLQEQNFTAEAEQIRIEEDAGFFRFGHDRKYGRE